MYPRMIAASREMNDVLEQLYAVAPFDVSVFLSGESGTGKELAAQRLHGESSRARCTFVAVNCAALPDSLLGSELFGHTRGAFTGAHESRDWLLQRAHGGTLFLDDVADLPTRAQTTLVRTLQAKEYRRLGDSAVKRSNFRLVSASHKEPRCGSRRGPISPGFALSLESRSSGTATTSRSANGYYRLGEALLEREQPEAGPTSAPALPVARRALFWRTHGRGTSAKLENEIVQALVRARTGDAIEDVHFSPRVRGWVPQRLRHASRDAKGLFAHAECDKGFGSGVFVRLGVFVFFARGRAIVR